ncbi:Gfo/Idh/MocA family oxidoreductase [Tropicibacter sp. R15_0]|uniref:Gfo/Idh/MocA family protein n=1 Tax=Tropicibacter sp. R15_0 TaxID=2821101 RepID=UPI001ADD2295|nr:Gfo/Idh/MocA family oxidoreductase [Tropicibacter sp. R15_0]MBO9467778.1 Gfo/Idh/MocA family oxidoreductase [Tropicibacter sp. R15_0]
MSKLRVAIAGAGAISPYHLTAWQTETRAELVAICDPDQERARARAQDFAINAVFTDVAEMLAATQPDAIDIITPVGTHAPLARLAADHGVHIMCQKPLCSTVQEASELVSYVGDRVRFMVHENYRFRPHFAEIAQRVAAGEIGKVRHVRMAVRSSSVRTYPGEDAFLLARQPYLVGFEKLLVFECLIHQLDALRAILGDMQVRAARLMSLNPDLAGEDTALISLTTDTGAWVEIDACIAALGYPALPGDRLELIGDTDTMILEGNHIVLLSDPQNPSRHDLTKNYQACFTGAISSFVTGIQDGTAFPTDRLDNLKTLKLMEAVYKMAETPQEAKH